MRTVLAVSLRAFEGATKSQQRGQQTATKNEQRANKEGAGLTSGMIAKKHMTKINVSCPFPSSAKWRAHL